MDVLSRRPAIRVLATAASNRAPRFALPAAISLIALLPAPARAEIPLPTPQAAAYHASFVPYLDPPPGPPKAVCLVDTGVNITPDTPPDNPDGPILARFALDGGSGEGGTADAEHIHGTAMASYGMAAQNGWGSVGFWPGGRIVSIRAMPADSSSFPYDAYRQAVRRCVYLAATYPIAAINLSLSGGGAAETDDGSRLVNAIGDARSSGLSVVAGAGNDGAESIANPANQPGVLSVGAGRTEAAGFCAFSNRGNGLTIIAPGCQAMRADPMTGQGTDGGGYAPGTSGATMMVSTTLALLRSYRPDLSRQAAEDLLINTAVEESDGAFVNVEAAMRAADLGGLVDGALARQATAEQSAAPTTTARPAIQAPARPLGMPDTVGAPGRMTRPVVSRARLRRGALTVQVSRWPRHAVLVVELWTTWRGLTVRNRSIRTFQRSITIRRPRRLNRIAVYYEDAYGDKQPSQAVRRTVRQLTR